MSLILSGTDGLSDVDGTAATPAIRGTDANTGIFFPAADTIAFAEGGAECARFDSGSRLLVGLTSSIASNGIAQIGGNADTRLIIDGSSTQGIFFTKSGADNGTYRVDASGNYNWFVAGAATANMTLNASGNLLVGQTTQSATTNGFSVNFGQGATIPAVSVAGASSANTEVNYTMYSTSAAAYRFYVGYGGTVFATSIVITAISDQRLKENIRDIDTGLDAIMALKPRRFDWKEGKGQDKKDVAGFIAQEFETIFPECVGTSKAGADSVEYKNINHETLIPTLVKAIQEQQALINQLTARITALENK